jgi:two-component system phosphate regulon sensor histidine kinase PhoR
MEMLDAEFEEIPLSPPTQETRAQDGSHWPIIAAGATGLVAVLVLALVGRLDALAVVAALTAVAVVTGACVFAADRSGTVRYHALRSASVPGAGEPPPFRALVDALPDPILVISATEADDVTSRRYMFANLAAAELLRLERGEGLLVNAIRDPAVLEVADQALFADREGQCVYETSGVQPRTLHAYARPLGLALDGRKLGLLVFRDETETRQVERTRVDFLANASHELRTPLASLTGFIETLRGHAKDDPAARERFLGIMQAQAARMSRLIDDLMSLSRIELAEHIAPAERTDLADCVQEVIEASAPIAERNGVELNVSLPGKDEVQVVGERDQLVEVVQNLVDNAIKYSAPGQAVEVVVEASLSSEAASAPIRPGLARFSLLTPDAPAACYAVLRVSDHGPGMAREHLPRLTERFYRVEGQKSGERAGSGLGLAIVKHIVNRHRGGLIVESAPGQGAAFTVYLPLLAPRAETGPADVAKVS